MDLRRLGQTSDEYPKPVIFTAKFEWLRYDCTFVNYDGTVLQTSKVNHGENVVYRGETPKRAPEVSGDQTIEWRFSGWDKPLTNITKDTIFTATFDAPNAVKCTFNNYDGSLLGYAYCGVGGSVNYTGMTPSKPDNDDGRGTVVRSEFTGWDKSLKNVKVATIFTAQFVETTYYRCDFVDYDGAVLQSSLVFDGGIPSYSGAKPIRDKTAIGTTVTEYSFNDWNKPLTAVSAPTVFTAVYNTTTFTGYRVDFLNSNGSFIYGDYFKQGTRAHCPSELLPWSYDEANVTMFAGWDESVSNLSSAVKTKAVTRTIPRLQNGEWPQTRETDKDIIDALNGLKPNSDGYYHHGTNRYAKEDSSIWRRVEPIRWRLLSLDGNDAFVISEKVLASRRYNEQYTDAETGFSANSYKNSEIRFWLNGEFLNRAFLDDSRIITTMVDNSSTSTGFNDNPCACENTNDKVFLLSYVEAVNDEYGFGNDVCVDVDGEPCIWWLRSPYYRSTATRYVFSSGRVSSEKELEIHRGKVGNDNGVRPALHFRLD